MKSGANNAGGCGRNVKPPGAVTSESFSEVSHNICFSMQANHIVCGRNVKRCLNGGVRGGRAPPGAVTTESFGEVNLAESFELCITICGRNVKRCFSGGVRGGRAPPAR